MDDSFPRRPKVVQSIQTICNEYASTLTGNQVGDLKQTLNKMTHKYEEIARLYQHLSDKYKQCQEELDKNKQHYYAMSEQIKELDAVKSSRDQLDRDLKSLLMKQAESFEHHRKTTEETYGRQINHLNQELESEQQRHQQILLP